MANSEQVAIEPPAILPLALAFEVVRRHTQGEIANPRPWLELIFGTASLQRILDELETQLAGQRPVDLSHWVMEDMPSHEARIVDDRTDLITAALLGAALRAGPAASDRALEVGPTVFSLRDQVLRTLTGLSVRADETAREYRIPELPERIPVLQQALQAAFTNYDRRLRTETLHARVDSEGAERMLREALETEWASGFPRALFTSVGSVEIGGAWDPKSPALTISQLELKEFFVEGKLEPSTMEMMGAAWARAFLAGELAACLRELSKVPARTWRLRSIRDRILRARDSLAARGKVATHVIGPSNWRLWRAIGEEETLGGASRGSDGFVGTFQDLAVYEVFEDIDSLFVLEMPSALRVQQRLINNAVFEVSVKEIDEDVLEELRRRGTDDAREGPGETPNERLRLRTWVLLREAPIFHVDRSAFVRVEIPPSMRR